MIRTGNTKKGIEAGGTLLEFTFVATTFFMMLLAITSGSNLYFTHNALVEATRRSARFAATQAATDPAGSLKTTTGGSATCDSTSPSLTAIRNVALYGNPGGTGPRLVSALQAENFCVHYESFGVGTGSVSVRIIDYNFNLVIPGISRQIVMPTYRTTVAGESAGAVPLTCP